MNILLTNDDGYKALGIDYKGDENKWKLKISHMIYQKS